MRNEDS